MLGDRLSHLRYVYQRQGLRTTVRKVITDGMAKRAYSWWSYQRFAKQYPQDVIFIASLPKSGSTWVAKLFASCHGFAQYTPVKWHTEQRDLSHDLYPEAWDEMRQRLAVIKGHTAATAVNLDLLHASGLKYFITVRDPRDALISAYWYIKQSPYHPQCKLANRLTLNEFIEHKLATGEFRNEYVDWIDAWLDGRDPSRSMVLLYQELLSDTEAVFRSCLKFLGFPTTTAEQAAIIQRNSFKNLTHRNPGEEQTQSFLRKGVAGEWQQVFTPAQQSEAWQSCCHVCEALHLPSPRESLIWD